MSKKSRRRNKKILALLGGLGAATMLGRRKRNAAIDKGIASAEADKGSDMLYSEGVPDRVKSIIAASPKKSIQTKRPSIFDTRFSKPGEEIISKADRAKKIALSNPKVLDVSDSGNVRYTPTNVVKPGNYTPSMYNQGKAKVKNFYKNVANTLGGGNTPPVSNAGNQVPPSMRGGAETAEGFARRVPVSRTGRTGKNAVKMGWSNQPYKKSIFSNIFRKGGRVKLAKRGLGRAFTKSKK